MSRSRRLGQRSWVAAVAAFALLCAGCERCSREEAALAPAPAPAPPRPPAVLAEFVVPEPALAYRALRPLFGAPAALLPSGPEIALSLALGLDATAAGSFDLSRPFAGTVALPDSGGAEVVAAVPLALGSEFVARLSTGPSASHRVQPRPPLLLLIPRADKQPSLAVIDDALLIGSRAGLERSGSYLARGLLRKPVSGAPRAELLPQTLAPAARRYWKERRSQLSALAEQSQQRHGRPADFAEPAAVLASADLVVETLLTRLEAARSAEIVLAPGTDQLTISARLRSSDAVTGAPPALGPELLSALPAQTLAAFASVRGERPRSAPAASGFLRALLGARLEGEGSRAFENALEALDAVDSARGERQVIACLRGWSLVWAGDVADRAAMASAFDRLFSALARTTRAGATTGPLGSVRLTKERAVLPESKSPAERYRFRFQQVGSKVSSVSELEVLVWIEGDQFVVTLGRDADPALALVRAARAGTAALGSSRAFGPALTRLLPSAGWVLLADAGLLTGAAPAAVLASAASTDEFSELRVELSSAALEGLARWGLSP